MVVCVPAHSKFDLHTFPSFPFFLPLSVSRSYDDNYSNVVHAGVSAVPQPDALHPGGGPGFRGVALP
jgi:hypothetical protein